MYTPVAHEVSDPEFSDPSKWSVMVVSMLPAHVLKALAMETWLVVIIIHIHILEICPVIQIGTALTGPATCHSAWNAGAGTHINRELYTCIYSLFSSREFD